MGLERLRGLPGITQKVDWQFEYAGSRRFIPKVYRFSRGIVFDIVTPLDEAALRRFVQKYEPLQERLTPSQRRTLEGKHPYQSVPVKGIWINGKQVEGSYSSSSAMYLPFVEATKKAKALRRVYPQLRDIPSFALERYRVPYPKAGSKYQKLLRFLRLVKISEIKLTTFPAEHFYPLDMRFEMLDGDQKEFCFVHPLTGTEHTLYFQNTEPLTLPVAAGDGRYYMLQAMYELEPALPEGDRLQFDSSTDYKYPGPARPEESIASSVASIGIIGGADGPTSIFIASKEKNRPFGWHGLPLQSCLSVPGHERSETYSFHLAGISIKCREGEEFILQG